MPAPVPLLESAPPPLLPAVVCAMAVGLVVALTCRPILRRLPEPDTAGIWKRTYAELATPAFAAATGAASAAATLLTLVTTPPWLWPAWASLAVVNVWACAIDAATTWLPARLSRVGWLVAGVGALVAALAWSSWTPLLAAALGALVVGGFFHLVWRLTGALGYGDVRLAATIGAVTAMTSPTLVGAAVLTGTLLGAVTGVALRLAGRRGGFPYGPGLLAGAFLPLLLPG